MANYYVHEDFLRFESKVNQVLKALDDLGSVKQEEGAPARKDISKGIADHITDDNFIVNVRHDRTVINKKTGETETKPSQLNKCTFMRQIEQDADERARVRRDRERLAQKFRRFGNEAYRKMKYERAVLMYTKAIEHVNDSSVLYNDRGLAYLKLHNNRRAVADFDYVVNKLDEKNIHAWLHRAAAYKRIGDESNFETSIAFAKKHNTKEHQFIDDFVHKIRTGQY